MNKSLDKKAAGRIERETRRKAFAAPAWRLWNELARNDVMADSANRDSMMERHKIVVAMIEINSQQLRCDSASAGLDIERLTARREVERAGSTQAACDALTAIDRRTSELEEKKRKLRQEREWLEQSLAEFDALMPVRPVQPKGHA